MGEKHNEKEPLLPFDKNATIYHLVNSDDDYEECKNWEEDGDSDYIMSEFEDDNEEGAVEDENEGEEVHDFDEITESDDSGAEMVIENPFEEVEPASSSGVKLEAVSLDNIITSGRRRNQHFF